MKDRFDLESDITRTSFYAEVAEDLAKHVLNETLSPDDLSTALCGLAVMLHCHQDRMFDTMKQCFKLDEYRTKPEEDSSDFADSYDAFIQHLDKEWITSNKCRNLRYGQFLMNTLYDVRPDLYQDIMDDERNCGADSSLNCFYDDKRVERTKSFLRDWWDR